MVCNQLLLGNMTLWSVDFSLDLEIGDYCSLNSVLNFYLFSLFNSCSFIFVISMNLWVLMAELLGSTIAGKHDLVECGFQLGSRD